MQYNLYPAVCNNKLCLTVSLIVLITSIFFALIEIEIEGDKGWAEDLKTVNLGKDKRSLTLYHLYFGLFIFSIVFGIFFSNQHNRNVSNFLYLLSISLWFFTLEDIFWFTLNPHFKLSGYDRAWWHKKVWSIPVLYLILPISATILAIFSGFTRTYLSNVIVFLIGFLVVYATSPLYHRFYTRIHAKIKKNNKN